jgi:hypothetical protein
MQEEVTIKRLIIVVLKGWNSSDAWEHLKESKLNSGRN